MTKLTISLLEMFIIKTKLGHTGLETVGNHWSTRKNVFLDRLASGCWKLLTINLLWRQVNLVTERVLWHKLSCDCFGYLHITAVNCSLPGRCWLIASTCKLVLKVRKLKVWCNLEIQSLQCWKLFCLSAADCCYISKCATFILKWQIADFA